MIKLSQRRADFVIHYYKNKNGTEAAIMAGYSPNSAHVTASRLLKNDKILARLEELNNESKASVVGSVLERKERLWGIAKEDNPGKFGYQRTPNIQAIAELNKMDGAYAPEKTAPQVIYSFNFILPDGTRFIPGQEALELKSGQESEVIDG